MYSLGLGCVLAALVVGGLVQRLVGVSSGSAVLGDGLGLLCGSAGALFFLRGLRSNLPSATAAGTQRTKANPLYMILGAVLAALLFVAVLYLTRNH